MTQTERKLVVSRLAVWFHDPVQFVRDVFEAEPDAWQREALEAIARDPRTGLSACKGPGKTTVLAWAIWWFLATRPHCNIICLSITLDNLRDNLWKELAVWHARPKAGWLRDAFEQGGERIFYKDAPKTWWCSARAFSQSADSSQQADTIAGLHAKRVMVVMDEMGSYPDGVLVAAEAIFANQDHAEARILAAWNPTSVDGPAYRVVTRDRKRWTLIFITGDPDEPKRSPRISKAWAQQQIDDWGRDNDWVRVNVLGQFPRTSSDKLLGPDDVQAAIARDPHPRDVVDEARVMGLDVAAMGDDRTCLLMRQGIVAWEPETWRKLKAQEIVDRVAVLATKHKVDMVFVDVSGGWGAAVYDGLKALGIPVTAVDFGGQASLPRFLNKRAEMYFRASEWVKSWGSLPADQELASELMEPKYTYGTSGKRTVFKIEPKADIKERTGSSPDKADAFVLTFAQPVVARAKRDWVSPFAPKSNDFQPSIG